MTNVPGNYNELSRIDPVGEAVVPRGAPQGPHWINGPCAAQYSSQTPRE